MRKSGNNFSDPFFIFVHTFPYFQIKWIGLFAKNDRAGRYFEH